MTDSNLSQIRQKIYTLRTAIMYSLSNDVCRLPNCIVTAVKVDDSGQLWFTCPRPLLETTELEEGFPVRLHFYHKGVFFHLEVSGKAQVIEKSHEAKEAGLDLPVATHILVRMSMNSIEYTEPYGKKERSRLEMIMEKGYKWMLKNLAIPHSSKPVLSKNTI